MNLRTLLAPCFVVVALLRTAAVAPAAEPLTFERDVRPILKAYCLDCHGGDATKAGLDLRLARFALRGGETGPGIIAGNANESLLLQRLRDGDMPPGETKVPAEQIAIIEQWIAAGVATLRPEPETIPAGLGITEEERSHWAYQPITRPETPAVASDRIRTSIDAFVLAKLQEKGLNFAPDADRLTLIRRVAFDLTGLPPTTEQIGQFQADEADGAYDRMVDRYLESPHYGERWARHWLDVAGYADSDGNGSEDTIRPYAYRYRDYVVRAFNADKPLNQFLIEQLAGDELVPRPWANLPPEQIETLAATGFLRMAPDGTSSGSVDLAMAANQTVGDALKVVGSSLLGLSVGCAQCHDHRYDPIPQEDYFRLRAVFEPALNPAQWRRPGQRLVSLYTDDDRLRAAQIEAEAVVLQQALDAKTKQFVAAAFDIELVKFPEDQRIALRAAYEAPADTRTPEQQQLLAVNPRLNISPGTLYEYNQKAVDELKADSDAIAAKRAQKPVEEFVAVLDEVPDQPPPATQVFHRGDYRQPTRPVGAGDLTVIAQQGERLEVPTDDPALPTTGRRLAFARHLTSGTHPLVGRVLANRIWLHHFGRGLVNTPADFGKLGGSPTHPELLDWLAAELPQRGWSLKQMHRLILTSTVYRQASTRRPEQEAVDSDNTLLARFPVQRLDAETLRDRILDASGKLDRTQFGPAVAVAEDESGQVIPANHSTRRSLYLQVRRSRPVSLLAAFDAPQMVDVNCDRRVLSTSAPQSLMLMNSDFVRTQSAAMESRVQADVGATGTIADRLARAWQLAYQRPISAEELDFATTFVAEQVAAMSQGTPAERELAALGNVSQQLLSSNEFLYLD